MFCIVREKNRRGKIEGASYWVKNSPKMESINTLLKDVNKTLYIEYYNNQNTLIDLVVLGK